MKFAMNRLATTLLAVTFGSVCMTCRGAAKRPEIAVHPDVNLDLHEVENSTDAKGLIEWLSVRTMPLISDGTAIRERERSPVLLDQPYKVTLDGSASG